jgi:hypothetical protein
MNASPRLSEDSDERKRIPIFSGVVKYFPAALAYVSSVSQIGNDKHNPGEPLHWSRNKSHDQLDALMRHVVDVAIEDGNDNRLGNETVYFLAQVAWRALAELQIRLEEKAEAARAEPEATPVTEPEPKRMMVCWRCEKHTAVSFSRPGGVDPLCRNCMQKMYPEFAEDIDGNT